MPRIFQTNLLCVGPHCLLVSVIAVLLWGSPAEGKPPSDFDGWYSQARTYENEGKKSEAVSAYQNALKFAPKNRYILEKLAELDAPGEKWWQILGDLDLSSGDTSSAINHGKAWIKKYPNSPAGYRFLLPIVENRTTEVTTHLLILEKLQTFSASPSASSLLDLGKLYFKDGQFDKAESCLLKSAKRLPENAETWFLLGKIRSLPENKGTGFSEFEKASRLAPRNVEFARVYGAMLSDDAQLKLNLKLFQFLNDNNPLPAEKEKLARSLALNNKHEEAAEAWKQALGSKTDAPSVSAARSFLQAGDLKAAARQIEKIPDDFTLNSDLADALYDASKYAESEKFFIRTLKIKPGYAKSLKRLGEVYRALESPEKAVQVYTEALTGQTVSPEIIDHFMDFLDNIDKADLRKKGLRTITAVSPGSHRAKYELAGIYLDEKNKTEAYKHSSEALAASPKNGKYQERVLLSLETDEQINQQFSVIKKQAASRSAGAEIKLLAARGYSLAKQTAPAAEMYEYVYKADAKLLSGNRDAVLVLHKNKDYSISGMLAAEYLKSRPDDRDVREALVASLSAEGKDEEALRLNMKTLADKDTGSGKWFMDLARLDLKAGDTASAVQNALKHVRNSQSSPEGYRFLLPLVKDNRREHETFRMVLTRLIDLEPEKAPQRRLELGMLNFEDGKYAEAEKLLESALKTYPDRAEIWFTLGKIKSRPELKGDGSREYSKAFKLKPDNLDYARAAADAIKSDDDLRKNLKLLQFIGTSSPSINERAKLAKSLYLNSLYRASAEEWKKLVQLDENFTKLDSTVVQAFMKAGFLDEAVAYSKQYAGSFAYNRELAFKLDSSGNADAALVFYELAGGLKPGDKAVQKRLAELYRSGKQPGKASETYRRMLSANPKERGLQSEYLGAVRAAGDRSKLKSACMFVLSGDSTAHPAWFKLAEILLEEGDRSAANLNLGKALALKPDEKTYQALVPAVVRDDEDILRHFSILRQAASSSGADAGTRMLCARGHVLRKEYPQAAELYVSLYNTDQKLLTSHPGAVTAFSKTNRCKEAEILAENILMKTPSDIETRRSLADCYRKDPEKSEKLRTTLKSIANLDTSGNKWWPEVAALALKSGDTAAAVANGKKWIAAEPQSPAGYRFLLPLLKDRENERKTAAGLLEKLIALEPEKSDSRRLELGMLNYDLKRYDAAETLLVQAGRHFPKDPEIFYRLGMIRTGKDSTSGDADDLKKAYDLSPRNVTYARAYGSELKSDEQVKRSLKLFEFLAESGPEPGERIKLARAYYLAGRYVPAAEQWKTVLTGSSGPASRAAIDAFMKAGDFESASKYGSAAEGDYDYHYGLAEAFGKKGEKENAVVHYLAAHKINPEKNNLHLKLAGLYEGLGQKANAVNSYTEALAAEPGNANLLKDYIDFLRNLDDPALKKKGFEAVATLKPDAYQAHFDLAKIYIANNDKTSAYQHLREALRVQPDFPSYQELLPQTVQTDEEILRHLPVFEKLASAPGADIHTRLACGRGLSLKERYKAAAPHYEAVFKHDRKLLKADKYAILAFDAAGKISEAAVLAEDFLNYKPKDLDIRQVMVKHCRAEKNTACLRENLNWLIELEASNGWRLELARLEAGEGNTGAALTQGKFWLDKHPGSLEGYRFLLPLVKGNKKEWKTYIEVLEKLVALEPDSASMRRLELGSVLYEEDRYKEAEPMLSRAVKDYPGNAGAWYRLGKIRSGKNFGGDGRNELKKAWEIEPTHLDYARSYGMLLKSDEEIRGHLKLFQLLIKYNPTIDEKEKLARAYFLNGDMKRSADVWNMLAESDISLVKNSPEALKAFETSGRPEDALTIYEINLKDHPDSLLLLESMLPLYVKTGKDEKRITALARIVELEPARKNHLLDLARLLAKKGDFKGAATRFSAWTEHSGRQPGVYEEFLKAAEAAGDAPATIKALQLLSAEPKADPSFRRRLGLLFTETGRYEEALRYLPEPVAGRNFDEETALALYTSHLALNHDAHTEEYLRKLHRNSPGNSAYALPLAGIENSKGRCKEVMGILGHPEVRPGLDSKYGFMLLTCFVAEKKAGEAAALGETLLQRYPDEAEGSEELGIILFKQKKYAAAEKVLATSLKSSPTPRGYYYNGLVRMQKKNWKEAIQYLKKAEGASPSVDKHLATAYKNQGRYKEALESLEKYYGYSKQPKLLEKILYLYEKLGDSTGVLATLLKLTIAFPDSEKYQNAIAEAYLARGDRENAETHFRKAQAINPDSPRGRLYTGMTEAEKGNCRRAFPLLESGLKSFPNEVRAWELLGDCRTLENQDAQALSAFKEACRRRPLPSVLEKWLSAAQLAGNQDELLNASREILKRDSSRGDAAAYLGREAFRNSDFLTARDLFRRAVRTDSSDVSIWEMYGRSLVELKMDVHAIAVLEQALTHGTVNRPLKFQLARLYMKSSLDGMPGKAVKLLNGMLDGGKGDHATYYLLAQASRAAKDPGASMKHLVKALELDPGNSKYLLALGNLFYSYGKYEKAVKAYSQVKTPLSPVFQLEYADALKRLGNSDLALQEYRKMMDREPSNEASAAAAVICLERGMVTEAEKMIAKARNNGDSTVKLAQMRIHLALGNISKARKNVEALAKSHINNPELHIIRGLCDYKEGDFSAAEADFSNALELRQNDPEALYHMGMCALRKRSPRTAEPYFKLMDKAEPFWKAKAGLGLSRTRLMNGKAKEARNAAMESVKEVRSAEGALAITRMGLDEKAVKAASKWADRAMAIAPQEPAAVSAKALVTAAQGRTEEALKLLQEAAYTHPKSCLLELTIAEISSAAGLDDRAVKNADKVIEQCPDMEEAYFVRAAAAMKKPDSKTAQKFLDLYKKYGGDPERRPEGN